MQLYTELNNPGSGSISVQRYDPSAVGLTIGKLVKVNYRGQPRSGFFIENIGADEVKSGERAAEWIKLAGRGAMTVLEDALVYPPIGYPTETTRTFTEMTMAYMFLILITEAQARGCFPSMRTEFSDTLDSNGDPWTDVSTLTFNVDTTLLDVVRQLVDLGLEFDFQIDWVLADYVLYAYQTPIGSDKSADVVFRPGLNCEDAGSNQESGELKNVLHISYQGGFVELADAGSQASYRRREAPFQAGNAITSAAAIALARPQLTAKKDPTLSITVKLADGVPNSPRAFVDYNLGDWVGYDNGSGAAPVSYRVRGMMVDWADSKYGTVTVDLNSVKLERELKNAIALRKLGNGVIGSYTSSLMPAGVAAAISTHNSNNSAHSTRTMSGGDLEGSLGYPTVAKLRGVALDNPLNVADRTALLYDLIHTKFIADYVDWDDITNKPSVPFHICFADGDRGRAGGRQNWLQADDDGRCAERGCAVRRRGRCRLV